MKVLILQHDILWNQPEANRQRLERQIDAHPGADLYVLSEMWDTGFATQPLQRNEPQAEASLRWMADMARRHQAALAGSLATGDRGQGDNVWRNRFCFVTPDGRCQHYDKRHLFTYAGEHLHYTPGHERVVVEWQGWRLLLAVCYDLRFPVWTRNTPAHPYDAILYVANWPASRIEAWSTLLRARAIENQSYVLGVNRVGDDPQCHYCGASAIIDPRGRTLAQCHPDEETTAQATLDRDALMAFRAKFPVLRDADDIKEINNTI